MTQDNKWPPVDMLIRSLNIRGNPTAKLSDDPLSGMPFPPDAWERIARYQRGSAKGADRLSHARGNGADGMGLF